jgi:hypothetical protein
VIAHAGLVDQLDAHASAAHPGEETHLRRATGATEFRDRRMSAAAHLEKRYVVSTV